MQRVLIATLFVALAAAGGGIFFAECTYQGGNTMMDVDNSLYLSAAEDTCAFDHGAYGVAAPHDYSHWEFEIFEDMYYYVDDWDYDYSYYDMSYTYSESYLIYTSNYDWECEDPAEMLGVDDACANVVVMSWYDSLFLEDYYSLQWNIEYGDVEGEYLVWNGNSNCDYDYWLTMNADGSVTYNGLNTDSGVTWVIPNYMPMETMEENYYFMDMVINTAIYVLLVGFDIFACFYDYVIAGTGRDRESVYTCIFDIKNEFAC